MDQQGQQELIKQTPAEKWAEESMDEIKKLPGADKVSQKFMSVWEHIVARRSWSGNGVTGRESL